MSPAGYPAPSGDAARDAARDAEPRFGVDYYPEHWPEERWETDASLMEGMGIGVVRLAEFAWHKLEPSDGRFDFAWLDRAIAVLGRRAIRIVLGTPSAAPPAWLAEAYPEILPLDSMGLRRGFGGRHHACHSNPVFRSHVQGLVTAMASRYGEDPRVIGWQVDNELGNSHDDFCHCESCASAFRAWLARKYGAIEELNRRWGTVFWSQTYDRFDQIPTPRLTPNAHSPSLLLDWRRFRSDLIVDFLRFQAGIIRSLSPGRFVTHNLMGFADHMDYFAIARELDFVSHDQYVGGFWNPTGDYESHRYAANLDLMAGLKRRSFWIMEQQAGQTGWQILGRDPEPGQLALWTAQSVARGADTVLFFRWRSCAFGTEQYWHGILPHSGRPGRRYAELGSAIKTLSPIMGKFEGALSGAEAAILYSYEDEWAFKIQPHHPELSYAEQVLAYYKAFHDRNTPVDFVSRDGDFSPYMLLVAPLLYICTPELEAKLADYVRKGGRLVLTMRTGVKNEDNVCMTERALPGAFGDLLGIEVTDYDCLRGAAVSLAFEGGLYEGRKWCDLIELRGAAALATRASGPFAGHPVVTEARAGAGLAYYVGTEPDGALMAAFISRVAEGVGLESLSEAPPGVELARRRTARADYLFALNHSAETRSLSLSLRWKPLSGGTELGPYGFSVFTAER